MDASRRTSSAAVAISYLGHRPETLTRVATWIYREWSFLYPGRTRRHVEEMLHDRLHVRKLPLTFVALAGGKPVGTVSLKELDVPRRRGLTVWIASLYVVPGNRNKGIGSDLMLAAERKAARLGIRRLRLLTVSPGLALRFYRKRGWTVMETIREQPHPIIIMQKNLRR